MAFFGLFVFMCSTVFQLFATPWTVGHQTPLSMRFSRQEYWSGLLFPTPGDLSNSGIKPMSSVALALQADSSPVESVVSVQFSHAVVSDSL